MWIKTYFRFICDYYETSRVLYNALYCILVERSEGKLRLFYKICHAEEKLRKSRLKLKLFAKKSIFLRKSVLHNYVIIISLHALCMNISRLWGFPVCRNF